MTVFGILVEPIVKQNGKTFCGGSCKALNMGKPGRHETQFVFIKSRS